MRKIFIVLLIHYITTLNFIRIKKEGLETLFFISKGETRTLDLSGMSRTL